MSGSSPKQIVLLLHGFGSNGADLISLAPHWQRTLPDALFLAPNAPQRLNNMAAGYQWWPLLAFTPQALATGAASAAPAIEAFMDRKLSQYRLVEANLAIVGYSGMLTAGHELSHLPITKPPILLVHGSADPIVPVAALHAAKAGLEHLGVDVTTHIAAGVGHSVDPVGLRMGGEFVAKALSNQN